MEVKDVANRLSVHPASVRRYIRSGRLKATSVESPHGIRYNISEEDLHEFENQVSSPRSQGDGEFSDDRLHDLQMRVDEIKEQMSQEERQRADAHEVVMAKIDGLVRMMEMIKDSVEELNREVSTMVDSRVKERDQQLIYAMKAMTNSDKKRRSLFGRA